MNKVRAYKLASYAIKAFDNGGRFYNFLTKAGDQQITAAELGKVAGVVSDRQTMALFLEMSIHDLPEDDQLAVRRCLTPELQEDLLSHPVQLLSPSQAAREGKIAETAILSGYPRFLEDRSEFSSFIMIPIMAGKVMTFMMVPIYDYYDLYELRDEVSSKAVILATVRGTPRLPETLHRFGGVLKETSEDEEGKTPGRCLLEARFYTPLED